MSLSQLRNCNMGSSRANATGSSGVGYTILDETGGTVSARTTTGVYQLTSGSGLYAAYVSFPDNFRGQIMWDTGTAFATTSYAVEQYNVEENDPKVSSIESMTNQVLNITSGVTGSIQGLYDVAFGRWKINPTTNQMIFYREDNATVVATFDLYDSDGAPAYDGVFERRLNGSVIP